MLQMSHALLRASAAAIPEAVTFMACRPRCFSARDLPTDGRKGQSARPTGAGERMALLNDVNDIASEEVAEMLTRVRDAKAPDMGNIDDSEDPHFRHPGAEACAPTALGPP